MKIIASKRFNLFAIIFNSFYFNKDLFAQNFQSFVNFCSKMLKFAIILFIVYIYFVTSARFGAEPYRKFTSIKCESTNKSITSLKCFLKMITRRNISFNVLANISRPLNKFKMQYELLFNDIGNTKRLIINETIDLCPFLDGTNTNPVMKWLIGIMSASLKEIIHPCPYFVRLFEIL